MKDVITSGKISNDLFTFDDENKVIWSHSRLAKIVNIPYETSFPIILTLSEYFTKLLVTHYHNKYEHAVGVEMVKVKLRNMFHIIGLNNLLK